VTARSAGIDLLTGDRIEAGQQIGLGSRGVMVLREP
jgi:hypothetical protein